MRSTIAPLHKIHEGIPHDGSSDQSVGCLERHGEWEMHRVVDINRCRHDFRRLLSGPLQNHIRLLDHTSEECLRLLRPLLEILLTSSEFLRTSKTFHINETRSILPNLGLSRDC